MAKKKGDGAAAADGEAGAVKVRVLVAGEYAGQKANGDDVIELSEQDAELYAGAVDSDPDAVAYAESLKA